MSPGKHSKRRPGGRKVLVGVSFLLVVLFAVAALAVRIVTEPIPAAQAQLEARFPTSVPGALPPLSLPSAGEGEVTTAGGRVLGATPDEKPEPIASVTKVMTAYIILRDFPLSEGRQGPVITVSDALADSLRGREAQDQSLVEVRAGEKLTEMQALQALLIPSADDIADLLAVFDARSIRAFAAKMNAVARSFGMTHTYYNDASGFSAATVSTAADQALLARQVMQNPVFAQIVDERSATLPVAGTVTNFNSLVGTDGYDGIKTGSTIAAGGCLMWSVTRKVAGTPITLYGVVLGQRDGALIPAAVSAAEKLTDSAYKVFTARTVLPAGTKIFQVTRAGQRRDIVTTNALTTIMPPGTSVHIAIAVKKDGTVTIDQALSAQVTMTVGDDDATPEPASPGAVNSTIAGSDPATAVRIVRPLTDPSLRWRLGHAF